MIRSVIQGCGSYLPARVVTNADLAKTMDTSDEWIQQRTGICQRHIAAEGEMTSHLALKASERALEHAGLKASDLDLIVLATATPDETFPATATRVQAGLGMTKGAAFDVQAVCAGFVYGLSVADSLIKNGLASTALVIGAETFSRILDWDDRGTCVLFGDGAGAVVLKAEQGAGTTADRGVLANALHSDGRQRELLGDDLADIEHISSQRLRRIGLGVQHGLTALRIALLGQILLEDDPESIVEFLGHRLQGQNAGLHDLPAQPALDDDLLAQLQVHRNAGGESLKGEKPEPLSQGSAFALGGCDLNGRT